VTQKLADDLPLFHAAPAKEDGQASKLVALLAEIRLDELTPKDALEWLYKLKAT